MSNRGLRIIWFRLHTEKGRGFRLLLPISLGVFRELLDSILDLMTFICIFAPKTNRHDSHMSIRTVRELIWMLMDIFGSISEDGPYDLVDVSADNVKVSMKIR